MEQTCVSCRRILLLGLEESLASELQDELSKMKQEVYREPFKAPPECLRAIQRLKADLVFCPARSGCYKALLGEMRKQHTDLPVVVVSRHPEVPEWLDAIEAGASDYCAAPFEPTGIRWLLQSVRRQAAATA